MTRIAVVCGGINTALIIKAFQNASVEAVVAMPEPKTLTRMDVGHYAPVLGTGKRKAQWKQETRGRKQP